MPRLLPGKEHKVASSMNSAFQRMLSDSKHAVSYMISEITHICRNMKKRAPGSEGEREAAKYMAGILRSDCGCQNVRLETFREHPAAFYGYFWFSMVFDTLSAILYFVSPWLSILSGCAALFLFVVQFGLYRQVIDRLFPEEESCNVTAIRPCAGEVQRRIFLNGHTDAAWEFPLNYYFGGIVFEIDRKTGTIQEGRTFNQFDIAVHPYSKIKVAGHVIERWEEILAFVKKAHLHAPEGQNLIGWDVCVSDDGLSLIEGGSGPGFPELLDPDEDLWGEVKGYLDRVCKR